VGCTAEFFGDEQHIADVHRNGPLQFGDDEIISGYTLVGHVKDDPDLIPFCIQGWRSRVAPCNRGGIQETGGDIVQLLITITPEILAMMKFF